MKTIIKNKKRVPRRGALVKIDWIRGILRNIEEQIVCAKKKHAKIKISPIYANAMLAHASAVALLSGDLEDLPAAKYIAVKAGQG